MILPEIKSIAEYAYDALLGEIKRFSGQLPDDMELGIVSNGGGLIIHIEKLYQSGQMVVFIGSDGEGRQARLIQHYTQANVQMIAVKKLDAEARRIGF